MDTAAAAITEEHVRWILQMRRGRARVFGPGLFADPAWDILLQLYAARLGGRETRLADLASDVPHSSLVRWIAVLEEQGLIFSPPSDESDSLELSSAAAEKMHALFRTLPPPGQAD